MKAYTYSSYANYAHLHMYLIGKRFEQEIVKNHLDQENYNFNISIDENVVTWEFSTDNRKIVNILSRTISNQVFSEAEIQNAVKEIAKKIVKMTKCEAAKYVGKIVAERALAKGIKGVAFDRSGFKYHGRIQSLADAAREAGLQF